MSLLSHPRRSAAVLLAITTAAGLALATPAAESRAPAATPVLTEYVVVYVDQGLSVAESRAEAADLAAEHGADVEVELGRSLDGFVADLTEDEARALAADPRVDYLEPAFEVVAQDVQSNPPNWALDRIDQRAMPLNASYSYPSAGGAGAHIYVVDSGIRSDHQEFTGRVGAGRDVIDNDNTPTDCAGHGTHVAGTAAGTTYGVAKKATIHAVRILDCEGEGSSTAILAAIEWIIVHAQRPAVVNHSLGCTVRCSSPALDAGVQRLIASGIQWVQAVGNSNDDACFYSPNQVAAVLTVGASTATDAVAVPSNFGSCVDLWAPGTDIVSAAHTGSSASVARSGTSMAAPHVAGAVALYLGLNPSATPAEVRSALVSSATTGRLTGLPAQSPDRLLFTGSITRRPVPPNPCRARTNGADVRIRDFRTVTSRIRIDCAGNASARSKVTVRIAHSAIGDLKVSLTAPDGTVRLLRRRTGGDADDIRATYTVNLSSERALGSWRLLINDNRRGGAGRLTSWMLAP